MHTVDTRNKLDILIAENLDYLFRFAFFRIGNRQDAEDIVQSAFLKLLEKYLPMVKLESVRMYMFKTVYNMCNDFRKNTVLNVALDGIDVPDICDDDATMYAEYDRIQSMLQTIPKRESEVILMRAVDELSFVEIGQILDLPPTTVQYRYKTGMDKLRSTISLSDK